MPDNPFTPELHLLLKQRLRENLTTISGLSQEGLKLKFTPATGLFEHERDGFGRTMRNLFADNKDSASADHMFAAPLLVTFYECKKLSLKVPDWEEVPEKYKGRLTTAPNQAFETAQNALVYLKDRTYANKPSQKLAIQRILEKVAQLGAATDRPALDKLIAGWVDFVVPGAVQQIVNKASGNADVRNLISDRLTRGWERSRIVKAVGRLIYDNYYKTGGGGQAVPEDIRSDDFVRGVAQLTAQQGARATDQNLGRLNALIPRLERGTATNSGGEPVSWEHVSFMHIDSQAWACEWNNSMSTARVYIHLKASRDGRAALDAMRTIFTRLPQVFKSVDLHTKFNKFKIANLPMLYEYADSIVMWTSDYAAARLLAQDLSAHLAPYTAGGLPTGVRPIGNGVGISTEPEVAFDPRFLRLPHAKGQHYSFGTHRSEVIARGLLAAALENGNTLPNAEVCNDFVAIKFSEYGIDPHKPYKQSDLFGPPVAPRDPRWAVRR